jgi:carbon-monoxide dehydrogenase small subunit
MSACELLSATPDPSDEEISDALGGNICRCTGYQSILESVRLAGERMRGDA